ncbi:MAG: GNAT family N-acetyltransferase, partial [Candidatus Muiribacteriaceae bacterium]
EAVEKAFRDGFVIAAFTENVISGIAVVCRMSMRKVLPEFHLVYIGADIKKGSKGIGSYLMKKIIKLTNGDFSLHVDLDNKKAIRVYEKMGLKKSYIRMIYSNEHPIDWLQ